jgi:hypothetical protein
MQGKWERLIRLVRETGDRLVVTDSESEDVFVLMSIGQYEELLGGQDTSRHDDDHAARPEQPAVNQPVVREIAGEQYEEVVSVSQDEDPPEEIWDVLQSGGGEEADESASESWDVSRLNDEEKAFLKRQYEKFKQGDSGAQAPVEESSPTTPQAQSEPEPRVVVEDDKDDDFTEEQFYLEPIE